MSYILDALKRADTERERERGTVPSLHSQNLPSGSFQRDRQRQSTRLPPYATWVGLLVLALVVGWYFWPTTENRQVTASAPVLVPGPAPSPTPTTEAPVLEPAPSEPLTTQAPDLPILAPPPSPPPPPPRAVRTQASGSVAGTTAAAEGASTPAAPAAPATTPAATAGTAPPAAPVRRFAELSPELRAQLPQVNVSGSTYSSNPKLRTLIANGKVIQEGDEIAPGLQVETIGQRSAVLNFQGTRYSIGF
ncbi:general secretion pathway protein GspB [Hydrogenophaga sp.]|uniref:general secretion pathway protein GspB n=1 Tax=Hydrogenophaga sp. TaxID=1904254 RepID=UPI0027209151|nr:general secretion pathway protein GspB [Hydrogenophaga sp.]MDO8905862.1 general secretion pathway protein GspB [Hydrogenophaga sp.]